MKIIDSLEKELDENSKSAIETEQILQEYKNEMKQINSLIREHKSKQAELRDRMHSMNKRKEDVSERLRKSNQKIRELKFQLGNVKQNHDGQFQKNFVLEKLLTAQKNNELTGILGPLGQMASIEDKYYRPVCMAGFQLSNIVVKTLHDGEKAIQYLRSNKIGTVSLIVMEKVPQYGNSWRDFVVPPGAVRILDILNINGEDEAIRNLFFHAFRNTLILPNLELARKLFESGKVGGVSLVTYNGEMIDEDGLFRKETHFARNLI